MTIPSLLCRTLARLGATIAFAAFTLAPAAAQQPPRDPGSGFVAADAPPPRLVEPDVEPVWRAPAVDTLATVRKRGTLRVGVVGVEPLVMHDAKGELVGYSVDLARQLADDIGVGVEFVRTSWTQVIPDLLARRFDLIASGLWPTPARSLVINFSAPTSRVGIHLVANRALAAGRTTVADFNRPDVTIVTYGGTMQEGIARRLFPQARLMRVDGNADYLDPVVQGRAHAALVPTFAREAVIGTDGDKLVLPLAEPLASTVTASACARATPTSSTSSTTGCATSATAAGSASGRATGPTRPTCPERTGRAGSAPRPPDAVAAGAYLAAGDGIRRISDDALRIISTCAPYIDTSTNSAPWVNRSPIAALA